MLGYCLGMNNATQMVNEMCGKVHDSAAPMVKLGGEMAWGAPSATSYQQLHVSGEAERGSYDLRIDRHGGKFRVCWAVRRLASVSLCPVNGAMGAGWSQWKKSGLSRADAVKFAGEKLEALRAWATKTEAA